MFPIASHTNDPATSNVALSQHEASGKRQRHCDLVLLLVHAFPGETAIELYDLASAEEKRELKEPQEVRRRLSDLYQQGKVERGSPRRCTVKGTKMVVWRPMVQK